MTRRKPYKIDVKWHEHSCTTNLEKGDVVMFACKTAASEALCGNSEPILVGKQIKFASAYTVPSKTLGIYLGAVRNYDFGVIWLKGRKIYVDYGRMSQLRKWV